MRVALINTLPLNSSITKENIVFANSLSNSEDVLLILKDDEECHKLETVDHKVQTRFVKIPRTSHISNIHTVFKIIKEIGKFKPEVIDLRSGYPWLVFILPFLKKYPLVSTFVTAKPRKGEKQKIPYRLSNYLIRKYADQIIVCDQISKKVFVEEFKLPPKRIHVIPDGNYSGLLAQNNKMESLNKEKYVLFLGRIVEYKGLEYLIKAEPLITSEVPNAKIIIAGSCDNFEYYESFMNNKNSFLVYNEWVSDETLVDLFKKSNIVVFPYTEYSNSGNIHLAYSFKKPIVATNLGSISEYIKDGETGFLVPSRNPEELSKAIVKLLKNDDLAQKMGQKGYELMTKSFSWEEITFRAKAVYKKAIENKFNH